MLSSNSDISRKDQVSITVSAGLRTNWASLGQPYNQQAMRRTISKLAKNILFFSPRVFFAGGFFTHWTLFLSEDNERKMRGVSLHLGLMNYIDTKAKCCHVKNLTCKGTLRQVFIIVYILQIQRHVGIFDPAFWTVAPLTFSLVQLSPSPPFPVWIRMLYTRMLCLRGGGGVMGFWASNTWTPFRGKKF